MKSSIFLVGSSGFVGKSIARYFGNHDLFLYAKGSEIKINESVVINCAGKAHDLQKVSSPDDYYKANTKLLKVLYDAFLVSKANVFITFSSVKAVADEIDGELLEDVTPNPLTHYGKSKLLAEEYILSRSIPDGKRVYILRSCMIHGPGNKGNLNLLYNFISRGFPWPLGSFTNYRSYLSIENLFFIINELIERQDIASGVYNVADDIPLSTNEVIQLISESRGTKSKILNVNKFIITSLFGIGNFLKLPLNYERLHKLTNSYVVSNAKIKSALGKQLPISSKEGLLRTFKSFSSYL